MASPFQYFRKRQKAMLVVFGVGIIFMFTVGPTAVQFCAEQSGRQGGNTGAVVSWKGGELSDEELYQLRIKNRLVTDYLIALLRTVAEKTQTPPDVDIAQVLPGLPSDGGDYALFQLVFLSELAREKGIAVTDEAVFAYLEQLTGGNLTRGEMNAVLASKNFKGRLNDDQLFDYLYKVVAAGEMQKIAQAGTLAIAPADALALAERDELKASVEFIPVRVEDFVDHVNDPTDSQVEELFEKYKAIPSVPFLPEPGFKKRYQAKFAYFEADYEKFVAEVKANLTDEEVKDYYEENKDFYVERDPIDPSDLDPDAGVPEDGEDTGSEGTTDEPKTGEASDEGETEDDSTPKDDATEGDDATTDQADDGVTTEPTGDAGDDTTESDAATEPTGESDGEDAKTDAAAEPTDESESDDAGVQDAGGEATTPPADDTSEEPPQDETSETPTPTPDPTTEETDADATGESNTETTDEASTDSDETDDAAEPTAGDTSADTSDGPASDAPTGGGSSTEGDTPEPAADEATAADADEPSADEAGDDDADEISDDDGESGDTEDPTDESESDDEEDGNETVPEKKYKPLEEVAEEIREYLATRNAQQAMEAALSDTENDMQKYFNAYTRWENVGDQEGEVEPEFAPVKKAALERGLTFGETDLVDIFTVRNETIGEALQRINIMRFDATGQQQRDSRQQTFASHAFANPVLRKPALFPTSGFSQGQGGTFIQKVPGGKHKRQYIYWVADESEEAIPDLADVRDDVVRAWKMMQAFPLAMEKAKEHAEESRESSRMTLEEIHGSTLTVVPVEEFTFYGDLDELPDVAPDEIAFRKAVAALEAHEVGVIPNRAQTVVYVARVQSKEPSDEAMRRTFMNRLKPAPGEPGTQPRLGLRVIQEGVRDSQNTIGEWFKQLSDDYEVKWERTPQAASQER
jgi:hypothetical protein